MREPGFVEQFLRDVATHKLYIERDDGLYRHLRFRATEADGSTSGCMGFNIVTWPGWLAYSGDMGTFVFQRTADMLAFFRKAPVKATEAGRTIFDGIDRRYWAEKCEAADARGDGIREFELELFKREITEQRRRLLVRRGREWTQEQRSEFWDDLQDVIDAPDEWDAIHAMREWTYTDPKTSQRFGLDTDDFPTCEVYTQRFNWCCCALAWAVAQYDAHKAQAAAPAANDSPTPTATKAA